MTLDSSFKKIGNHAQSNKKQVVEHDTLLQEYKAKTARTSVDDISDGVLEQFKRSQFKDGPFKLDYSTIIGNSNNEVYEDNREIEGESATASQSAKDIYS
ncbi:hypothetical protein RhiirA4_485292 [Rhizophagus irregularis]|uniref:Uncharacterized protein n=1 Tax=Rhizophagus irregularis TaxID=588596 RepID=A0A2I1HQ66_9GLOM|nr:hypothetical protein RhiirA4_485281 [Rhizophagus irregularis]PKY60947.1 hypothetical protein RhiirA4_485292 [Rhizophagus irregularis]